MRACMKPIVSCCCPPDAPDTRPAFLSSSVSMPTSAGRLGRKKKVDHAPDAVGDAGHEQRPLPGEALLDDPCGGESSNDVSNVLVACPEAEDEAAAFLGEPGAHDGCVDWATRGLGKAVEELGEDKEEEAEAVVGVDDVRLLKDGDHAQAQRGADEAHADDHVLGEHVAQAARDEGPHGVGEHEGRVHLREDDLVDAALDEVGLNVGVALAGEVRHGVVDKGHHEDHLLPLGHLGRVIPSGERCGERHVR
mmetsp:Transcript_12540/g.33579  ORF Transcript_12540/g.33579 Transcript_12540/m.33579 type:complete len:250 (-) Transcript_12540:44-793(-)